MPDHISDFPVTINVPIAWGDMDAFQHVNNVVYFRHFESARIAYFEKIDFLTIMNQTGIGPILAATQCQYKIPLTYPDQVTVGARVEALEEDRFTMKYVVLSQQLNKIAATGEGRIVTFDYQNNQKVPMPEALRDRLFTLEPHLKTSD